jgi:hypothetical protein
MQKVSDRQDTDVNPPTGGRVVVKVDQPGACRTGTSTVVGTAAGVVVGGLSTRSGDAVVVVNPVDAGLRRWTAVGPEGPAEQPAATRADAARLIQGALLLSSTGPPSCVRSTTILPDLFRTAYLRIDSSKTSA